MTPADGSDANHGTVAKSDAPLLFLSHLHNDVALATILSRWIRRCCAGNVRVFQSSSFRNEGPAAGRPLREQLEQALLEASVVILLCTREDEDWSWCTYECGVAVNDLDASTSIVIVECYDWHPELFSGTNAVDMTDRTSVMQFARDLMTDPDFFPGHGGAITGYSADAPDVERFGEDLYEDFGQALPGVPDESWRTQPFICLSVEGDDTDLRSNSSSEGELDAVARRVRSSSVIDHADMPVGFFGMRIRRATHFEELVDAWQRQTGDTEAVWFEGLCEQVMQASTKFIRWDFMRSVDTNDHTRYSPQVMAVRQRTRLGQPVTEYDIYFCRFNEADIGEESFQAMSVPLAAEIEADFWNADREPPVGVDTGTS